MPQFYNDIDAVKYFTTGTMSGNTLKPNMRKLGWLKKKGNQQKQPTKFVQLQSDLREH